MSDRATSALRDEFAETFKDADVAKAYGFRLPYPEGLFIGLARRLPANCRRVVDLGCGTGDLSLPFASQVDHIDAVDFSDAMLKAARAARGQHSARISWHHSSVEDFNFRPPYGLAMAGESLHWFDLPVLLPRLAGVLCSGAVLAIISRVADVPWSDFYARVAPKYSMSNFVAPQDIVQDIIGKGLAREIERFTVGPHTVTQTIDDYIRLQHSGASFAAFRMGAARAQEFDVLLRESLAPFAQGDLVSYEFSARAVLVIPLARG
jgi:SAM-dependent methyltransferase